MVVRTQWLAGLGVLLAAAGSATAAGQHPVAVFVNQQRLDSDALMLEGADRTVLPMRTLFEALGAQVEWDPGQQAVYAWKPDGDGVRLAVGERAAQILRMSDDPGPGHWGRITATHQLDAATLMVHGRVYVPLRFASEALHADVRYVSYEPAVHIRTEQDVAVNRGEAPDERSPEDRRSADNRRNDLPRAGGRRDVEPERDPEPAPPRVRDRDRDLNRDRDFNRDRDLNRDTAPDRERDPNADPPRARERDTNRDAPFQRDPDSRSDRGATRDRRSLVRSVSLTLELDDEQFSVEQDGEVSARLTVRNTGTRRLVIPFSSGQLYDLEALQGDRVVWNWARGRTFTRAHSSLELAPDEEKTFVVRWPLSTRAGVSVAPGRYLLRALLLPENTEEQLVTEARVTVTR